MSYININGHVLPATEANVQYSQNVLRHSGGLFETMLVQNGAIGLWPYHCQRFSAGLKQQGFTIPEFFTENIETEVLATTEANGLRTLCRVRLQVFSEAGKGLQYIIECFPTDPQLVQLNTAGLTVGLAPDIQKANDETANLKSWNISLYETAVERAKVHHWDDTLIYNAAAHIIESTIANIFWIKDETLFTPLLSEGCVAGVMRRYLLEQLPAHGYTVQEQPLTNEILKKADAVFLTNAIRRIKWVRFIGDTEYGMNMIPAIYNAIFPG